MSRYRRKPAGMPRRPGPPGPPGLARYPRAMTVQRIAEIMALGHPLARVCQMPGMPTIDLVMKWQRADPTIRHTIWEARALGADAIAEECLQIADDATPESVRVARLRINTRLRVIGAWAPEQYARNPAAKNVTPVQVVINFGAMGVRPPDNATLLAHSTDELQPIDVTSHPSNTLADDDDDGDAE